MIEVSRKGTQRPPRLGEALSLAVGSLATLSRLLGVRTTNAQVNGHPVGIAILDGVRFEKDTRGFTVLTGIETEKEANT